MMNWVRKALVGIGGLSILALLMTLVAPKAAHAIVSTLVTVANTSANPVPVDSTADDRASIVLIGSQQINPPNSDGFQPFLNLNDQSTFAVPVGKRFVIDQITASAFTDASAQPTIAVEMNQGNNHPYFAWIPLTKVPTSSANFQDSYSAMQNVKFFVDPGGTFQVYFGQRITTAPGIANVFVVGHLIDCGAGCAGQ